MPSTWTSSKQTYSYQGSIKSDRSDELINIYFLRPIAGVVVRIVFNTSITPNHLTLLSIAVGLAAACCYLVGTSGVIAVAGLLVTLKDVLDAADGQLARSRNQQSRIGRFLDSIGDFVVNGAIFGAIGFTLLRQTNSPIVLVYSMAGLLGITLRVSYHVFYQVRYLHSQRLYMNNRLDESIRNQDLRQGDLELQLQRAYQFIYGWQDRLIDRLDGWCRRNQTTGNFIDSWYSDPLGLRLSGFIGLGSELFLLMICSLFNRLELYLALNILAMNGILLSNVLYRRFNLYRRMFNR